MTVQQLPAVCSTCEVGSGHLHDSTWRHDFNSQILTLLDVDIDTAGSVVGEAPDTKDSVVSSFTVVPWWQLVNLVTSISGHLITLHDRVSRSMYGAHVHVALSPGSACCPGSGCMIGCEWQETCRVKEVVVSYHGTMLLLCACPAHRQCSIMYLGC
jgi:hypothetical protein